MAQKRKAKSVAAEEPVRVSSAPSTSGTTEIRNKERVLVVSSRGITFRSRHLLLDILQLLPHSKKDAKLDTKTNRGVINEVAEVKGCSSALFFETRKHQDLYLWMAKTPEGPTVKFHVTNVHTMAELKLSGNHLKGSRPVLSFDAAFDLVPHGQLMKEMLTHVFATPKRHHRVKPFFDHVTSFSLADNRVWIRNYQVLPDPKAPKSDPTAVSLVEVGPRLCLDPIRIFAGSFGGPVLFENPSFVSPNALRSALRRQQQGKYAHKVDQRRKRAKFLEENPLPVDALKSAFK